MSRARFCYVPVVTYPDVVPDDAVLAAIDFARALPCRLHVTAFSVDIPHIASPLGNLLIDIPAGPKAKVRTLKEAMQLRKLFEYVGDRIGLVTEVVITDGRQPIGNGVGPVLEARDVMRVLENHPLAPQDLRQKSLRLAGRLLECDPDIRGGDGYAIARDILDSGRALKKMMAIIEAQGGKAFDHEHPQLGALSFDVCALQDGVVTGIDGPSEASVSTNCGGVAASAGVAGAEPRAPIWAVDSAATSALSMVETWPVLSAAIWLLSSARRPLLPMARKSAVSSAASWTVLSAAI